MTSRAVALATAAVLLLAGCGSEEESPQAGSGGSKHASAGDPTLGKLRSSGGYTLQVNPQVAADNRPFGLELSVVGPDGKVVRDYDVEQTRRMHLLLARRDLTGYQHLHPRLDGDGVWHQRLTLPRAGPYRLYADFKVKGRRRTLSTPLGASGQYRPRRLPDPRSNASAGGGYRVRLGRDGNDMIFRVHWQGRPVKDLEPYLGALGHLVAIRRQDMAYLHTHPEKSARGGTIPFAVHFPSQARYRLFVQFRHRGRVRTAAFTVGKDAPGATTDEPGSVGGGGGQDGHDGH